MQNARNEGAVRHDREDSRGSQKPAQEAGRRPRVVSSTPQETYLSESHQAGGRRGRYQVSSFRRETRILGDG